MSVKQSFILLAIVALISGSPQLWAQKSSTVHGDIVEITSYLKEAIIPNSPAGKEIAIENVKHGGAFALLEKGTKRLYLISPKENDTTFVQTVGPFLGVKSFIKGKVFSRSGLRLIMMEDIGKSIK